jgi:acetyl-CoA acetyltransferase
VFATHSPRVRGRVHYAKESIPICVRAGYLMHSEESGLVDAFIPYGCYWSTPFARWQGALAHLHSLEFAAYVAKQEIAGREIPVAMIDYGILGMTVPQRGCFYGLPWATGLMGAPHLGGPTVNQACATSARILQMAAEEVAGGAAQAAIVLAADRTSNGPHLYYPNPRGPGGTGQHEDWVLDNFTRDPFAAVAMVETAENVARERRITTEEQHEVTIRRYAQYKDALADDRAFHKRFMTLPFAVPDDRFGKSIGELAGDEGVHDTNAEGLRRLKPVREGGTVTYGAQTHPADGNAGLIVASGDRARELSRDKTITVRLRGFGQARVERAHMPLAPVPAARRALAAAGIGIDKVDAVKSHNPFAINDIVFSRETGFPIERMNNYGCSLVWGHPQGPTGLRAIIELIEELVMRGGGIGLFHGCAAGDTAMAVVLEVGAK